MNCNKFNENLINLFDDAISAEESQAMLQHIDVCVDCKEEYDLIVALMDEIKPQVQIKASEHFKSNILKKISNNQKIKTMKPKNIKRIISIAAVIAFVFGIIPILNISKSSSVNASEEIFKNAIEAMSSIKTMIISMEIRTLPSDNFEYIGTNEEFVKNTIYKTFGNQGKWKVEKEGRSVVMDGNAQYLFIKPANIAIKAGPKAGFVNWFHLLMSPKEIMEKEQDLATKYNFETTVKEDNSTTTLTISAYALGNFKHEYLLNKSILEANTKRVYIFDKTTKRLKSLEIYIQEKDKEILVLKTTGIQFNTEISDDTYKIILPEGVNWSTKEDIAKLNKIDLKNTTPEEMARMFFESLSKSDYSKFEILTGMPVNEKMKSQLKEAFEGLKIIEIGKQFKSGMYGGVFVPYKIQFKDGSVKEMKLAIRNDNKEKQWRVDGGF